MARARFTIGLLLLHNFAYDLAIEEFERAGADEEADSGRPFPMALWGAAQATMSILWQYSNCIKGQRYLNQLPDPLPSWLTDFELDMVKTGFELYPPGLKDCEVEDTQA